MREFLDRDPSLPVVLAVVVLTRAAIAVNWVWIQSFRPGDVPYYWQRASSLPTLGMAQSLQEYPTPMAWVLTWPQAVGGGSHSAYLFWFVALILVGDLLFCLVLWRSASAFRGWAVVCWSVFLMVIGPLVWLRFDLLPAVLVGAAAVLAVRRPAGSGCLLALGAALKLWPAVLFPLLLNRPGARRGKAWIAPLAGFGGVGLVVVVASLLAGGWNRLLSPLVWQADRGLQIEAVPASFLMALRAADRQTWQVAMSRYQAFELFGPGVNGWLVVADVLGVLGVLLGLALLVRHLTRSYQDTEAWARGVAVTMLAVIGLLIVVNKTLSPQYIVWLGGPLVALVAWLGPRHKAVGRWLVSVLVIAALSHVIYPVLYGRINGLADDPVWTPIATAVLVLRNLVLVLFTIDVAVSSWRTPRTSSPLAGPNPLVTEEAPARVT